MALVEDCPADAKPDHKNSDPRKAKRKGKAAKWAVL